MGKNITFNLGPTAGLSARQLTIRPYPGAGDDTIPPTAEFDSDVGLVETREVTGLADNRMYQAVLVDTLSDSSDRPGQVLNFNTGSLSYLGPPAANVDTSEFYILHMEDLSSSSSSSVSSISTSSVSSSSSSGSSSSSSVSSSSPSSSSPSSSSSMSSGSSSSSSSSSPSSQS